jgi:uncharacterized membrane protein YraQ (UPF0718 family)
MLLDQILEIYRFIVSAFLHIWPYLLVTIPLAVAVKMSGASKHIKRVFMAKPLSAIFLATIVGAFSPFCSCGVIPVIAALLISGVPLAPVMSFWIASPSMDPEIFFLSVGMIGWELAVWRLAITLFLSLGAGLITQFMMNRDWFGTDILRTRKAVPVQSTVALIKNSWKHIKYLLTPAPAVKYSISSASSESCTSCSVKTSISNNQLLTIAPSMQSATSSPAACNQAQGCGCDTEPPSFKLRLFKETVKATLMVSKFMALAFFLTAVITLYVPREWIITALGQQNPMSIFTAAAFGVPVYTSNLSALPIISGLLTQGMKPAAALAFLIAGPTTTLPAMAAVWPLVSHRVFTVYVSVSLIGAVLAGYLYDFAGLLLW